MSLGRSTPVDYRPLAQAVGAPLDGSPLGEVPVTPHFSLISETSSQDSPVIAHGEADIFVDWLSVYQNHGEGLPLLNDGAVIRYDADGELESLTLKKMRVEGSFDTSVYIRCDGTTVWFEGNVSKFGRNDNLFGFGIDVCFQRINTILATLGLPPFTAGKPAHRLKPNGQWEKVYDGARITRIDITQNFCAGSAAAAGGFMAWLSTQQASRMKTGTYGDGETVDFGRGSRQVYTKAYLKAPELLRHAKKRRKATSEVIGAVYGEAISSTIEIDPYLLSLADWCNSVGLVRWESTYKSTWLIEHNQQFLGAIDMAVIQADFEKRKQVFTRANITQDAMTELPAKLLSVYRMHAAGDDLTLKFSRAQFYKHRKALLPFGVDISVRGTVASFPLRTRVLTLSHAVPPAFYQRTSLISLAA